MSFAYPIARDGFYYNGDLYVEAGNLNRHKRATIPEITAILRPDLKQSKAAPAGSPPKDPVGHRYEAQLIHYGLPPSKDKARAKLRLLEALNTSRLVVPEGITRLEAQLKKEYAAADRKAKAQYKAVMTASGKMESASTPKKRKQPEPTNSVNVNINFGPYAGQMMPNLMAGMGGNISVQNESPAPKKPKISASATPNRGTQKCVKGPVARDTSLGQTATMNGESTNNPPKRVRPPQTARSSATTNKRHLVPKQPTSAKKPAVKKEPAIKQESYDSPSTPARPRQTARRSVPCKQESPTPKKSPAVKQEPNLKNGPCTPTKPKLGLINGSYSITCPTLENHPHNPAPSSMSLIFCLDTPSVWGAYDLGMFSGILHLPERPWQPSNIPIPCTWRGREHGDNEGEVSFGEDCRGEIAFWGDGRVEGWINVYGKCHFTGFRRPGPGSAPRSAASMGGEWDGYCDQGYEDEYDEAPYAEEPFAEDGYASSDFYAEEAYDEDAY